MNAADLVPGAARALAEQLRASRGFAHKRDIDGVLPALAGAAPTDVALGDDCAAIPDGDGYQLFAIEGFLNEFVEREPWFAGWCGVMVNASDIYAMGGRPTAVVDALWSRDGPTAIPILEGLAAASRAYGVPVVGGHSNRRNGGEQLAVAIVGRARRLLTSFGARPGEHLVAAIDLRGAFREPYAWWNAATGAPPERLRADLEILPGLAEDGLCAAAKDISMAGAVGTALMLLECSGLGAEIDADRIPRPEGVALERWLSAFPSYGFLLSVADAHLNAVLQRFHARGIAAAAFGRTTGARQVQLRHGGGAALLWDFEREAFIGCAAQEAAP